MTTLTVGLPNYGAWIGDDWGRLPALALTAEHAGIDRVSVFDHLVMGPELDTYPYGSFPGGSEAPWLEPLATLAAMAGATRSIRLATGVLIVPVRSAAALAKTAATIDVLSGGRLDLGVGTGWQAKEYEAVGLDFGRRGQIFTDTLAACHALWQGGPVSFESPTVSFSDVWCFPRPVQQGGVPLWIGGELHPRNLDRLVRFGSGWLPAPGAPREKVRDGIERLRRAFDEAGRDHTDLVVRVGPRFTKGGDGKVDLHASLASVVPMLEVGATDVWLPLDGWCRTPDEAPDLLRRLAEAATSVWG